ncbi:MAG: CoB--CoM heterodisulfide reductase iron-sulfur subunit A family protein [Marinifilaceae bacterium]
MEIKRIGVYICWCGTNIAKMVDVEAVCQEISELPDVVIARNYKYMCSDPGQDLIKQDIKEHQLNRVVVAACSPRIHEITFRKALASAGLNPYMFEMANIREQVSWVHTNREEATRKAKTLVAAAINKVKWHESLEKRSVEINPGTLIIGGGISGISAALDIADAGKQVYLIERKERLGGQVARIDLTYPDLYSGQQLIQSRIEELKNHSKIEVLLNSEIKDITGYIGNFEAKVSRNGDKEVELSFGNIIVATGLKSFDAEQIELYQYGKLPNVITSFELEEMLLKGDISKKDGTIPENVVILHCVGSRNKDYHEYCSRTCCMTALKYSNQLRSAIPKANIFQVYADMRAIGKNCEEMYTNTSRKGVMFLMFDQKNGMPKVRQADPGDECEMLVELEEKLSGEAIEVPADMVVLMVGMEAHENAKDIGRLTGVSMCGNQFYIEKHPKLDPVATTTDGVYVVGTCQAPKGIADSIAQARAAAARVLATINVGSVEVEMTTAVVNEDICCGCQTCVKVCPYTAITFDEEKKVSVVNEILCKGCGTCGSTCPTGAIRSRHFTDQQILSQIEGLMSMQKKL